MLLSRPSRRVPPPGPSPERTSSKPLPYSLWWPCRRCSLSAQSLPPARRRCRNKPQRTPRRNNGNPFLQVANLLPRLLPPFLTPRHPSTYRATTPTRPPKPLSDAPPTYPRVTVVPWVVDPLTPCNRSRLDLNVIPVLTHHRRPMLHQRSPPVKHRPPFPTSPKFKCCVSKSEKTLSASEEKL